MAVVQIGSFPAPGDELLHPLYQHAVYVKQKWGEGEWVLARWLRAVSAVERTFPGKSEAELEYNFGNVKPPDLDMIVPLRPKEVRDLYVCIQVLPPEGDPHPVWVGVLPAEQLTVHASMPAAQRPAQTVAVGDQRVFAKGFDYLLARRRVVGAYVAQPDPGAPEEPVDDADVERIGWSLPFNARQPLGMADQGNRSLKEVEKDGKKVGYCFGGQAVWTARDVIEYLLRRSDYRPDEPAEPEQTVEPHFVLDGSEDPADGENEDPLIQYLRTLGIGTPVHEGRDVWSLINVLIDRRRGLSAVFQYNLAPPTIPDPDDPQGDPIPNPLGGLPDDGPVLIKVFSMTDDDNAGIPANPNVEDAIIDEGFDANRPVVELDSLAVYDRVVAQGARVISCFTAVSKNGNKKVGPEGAQRNYAVFEPAWTGSQQAVYNMVGDDQRDKPSLKRVYRTFRLTGTREGLGKPDFDWVTHGMPEPGESAEMFILHPAFDQWGHVDFAKEAPFWNANKGIERQVPMFELRDFAAEAPEPTYGKLLAVAPPLLADKDEETGRHKAAPGPYLDLHRPAPRADGATPGVKDYERSSAQVTGQQQGLEFEVNCGPAAHALGQNHFTGQSDKLGKDACPWDFDEMMVTLAVKTDVRPTVVIDTLASAHQSRRVLTITMEDVKVWIVAKNTIVGANGPPDVNRGLQIYSPSDQTGGRVPRDDTDRLRKVAELAASFYGEERARLTLPLAGLVDVHPLGTFIKTVVTNTTPPGLATRRVHSVVTQRSWQFGEDQRTTIQTGHMELDVRKSP